MYYWSRWTNITTTEVRTDDAQHTRPSWRDTDYRLPALKETRPVIVVARSRTQAPSASSGYQRGRAGERDTSSRISLDIRRSRSYTTAPHALTPASWLAEATTQETLAK